MASSLQDQLLKAGLATKQGARTAQSEKRKKNKQKKKKGSDIRTDLEKELEQSKLDKQQKDLQLNQEQKALADVKAERAKVVQMVRQHGLADFSGQLTFNFSYLNKVKKLSVDTKARDALVSGRLGICVLEDEDEFFLLVDNTVRKLQTIDESVVAYLYDRSKEEVATQEDEEDPYAEYQIPDDLMW
jgi:uncharacterized protein YaiL (DUF2058 family)